MITKLVRLHDSAFRALQHYTADWLPGLLARFVFASVLLVYFLNSFARKVGEGIAGFFTVQDNAYFQIVPTVVERYDFNASQVPLFPYDIIVYLGTYSELLLPVLLVVGLFTRIAAIGMIAFVLVQSYVDIVFHQVDAQTVGAVFDRLSGAAIVDQRALWVFLLVYLVIYGPGRISVDWVLRRLRAGPPSSADQRERSTQV